MGTHMHSSGLRQWPCSASQPGKHRAVTKGIRSLVHHKDKAYNGKVMMVTKVHKAIDNFSAI